MNDADRGSGISRFLKDEMPAALLSFAFIFTLMFAYNILKPVRDAMAPDWSDFSLALLWFYNFVFSALAVSVYGFAISRLKLKHIVPAVYGFFAVSFVVFSLGSRFLDDAAFVDKAFYLWISLFSLFHISVFWSLMADLYSKTQALRLFAFIASGASVGTIAGSLATIGLVKAMGTMNLMLLAALILVAIVPVVGVLYRLKAAKFSEASGKASVNQDNVISGNPFAGFTEFVRNPFLIGIAVFILLYTTIGSFAYFEIKNLLVDVTRDGRAQIWAGINLTVNMLAIVTGMFATGFIASIFGLSRTLPLVPICVAAVLLGVAVNPVLAVVIVGWVVLKSGNYAITRPGREMLYTMVSREDRFKAKPVIDIVVYRGGDFLAGLAFASLTTGLSLGLGAMAAIGAVIAVIWAIVGYYLGRRYDDTTAAGVPAPQMD